ncbi:hypothetical protein E2542_SST13866 [Spatholobus suberectus]|nr:hypothetical protein E2542_SST13866 [Spatholobus suberectus]
MAKQVTPFIHPYLPSMALLCHLQQQRHEQFFIRGVRIKPVCYLIGFNGADPGTTRLISLAVLGVAS